MYPVPKLYQLKYEQLCVYYLCWKLHAVLTMFYLTENCCIYSFCNSSPLRSFYISNFIRENNHFTVVFLTPPD